MKNIHVSSGGSNGPFLCGKETTFEGGMREPSIAWWPGHIRPNQVSITRSSSSKTVSLYYISQVKDIRSFQVSRKAGTLMDLFPTLAELAGVDMPKDRAYDGSSLTSLFLNSSAGDRCVLEYNYKTVYCSL